MAKVLILGASGFLGRALVSHLGARGHDIHAVVRSTENELKVRSASAEAAILSAADLGGRAYDRVFNLIVDYGRGDVSLSTLIGTNLLHPLELIEQVEAAAVINVSTALPANYSDYAFSKKMLECSLDRLASRRGFRNVNVHLHNMYGPASGASNLVTFLASRMLGSQPVELSSGRNSRDFIYIDDVVSALEALSSGLELLPVASAVDIGSGQPTRLRDLVEMIQARTGGRSSVSFGVRPDNPLEPESLAADLDMLSGFGWRPLWPLERGLDETVRHLTQQSS